MVGIVMTVGIPYMINPDQGNWRGKCGLLFGMYPPQARFEEEGHLTPSTGGLSVLCLIWCWFRVPETKGRTFEELDIMFEAKVKTREFKKYKFQ